MAAAFGGKGGSLAWIDPSGNRWFLASHIKDLTPEEIKQAAEESFAAPAVK